MVIILLLCISHKIHAKKNSTTFSSVNFTHISTQNGLAADKVLDILQDKYGFMWFATENGLSRFDGINFVNYTHSNKDSSSISDNIITAISEDSYGNLWIGTQNGLNKYDRTLNRFDRYNTYNGLKNNYIRALHADKEGFLWIETAKGYLTRHNIKENKWRHFKHAPGVNEGNYYYWHIYEDSLQNLWIGGRTLNGILFSKESFQMTEVPTWSDKGLQLESAFFVQANDGSILSSSFGSIQKFDSSQRKFIHLRSIPFEATCAVSDNEGYIWIGGYGGLARWHYTENSIEFFSPDSDNPSSITSSNILCLYKSNDGNIWIGTENGVNMYSPYLNMFQTYKGYDVSALMEDNDRNLWVGTKNDGNYVFDLEKQNVKHLNYRLMTRDIDFETFKREKEVIRQYIRHQAIYNDKYVLPESLADNYNAYINTDLKFRYPNENHVSALYQDKSGMIYIGLWNHVGFNVYNPKNEQWKRYALWSKKPDYNYPRLWLGNPFGANWYNGFLEDKKGRLWCITWECFGLNLFNRDKGKFEFKHYFPNNIPRFPQGKIEQIYYDDINDRYIMNGENTYLGYYDCKEKRFYKFGETFPANYTNLDIVKGYYKYSKAKIYNLPYEFTCKYILPAGNDMIFMANIHEIAYMNLKDNTVHKVISMPENTSFAWTLAADKQSIIIYCDKGFISLDTKKLAIKPLKITDISIIKEKENVTTLLQTDKDELWIGTTKNLWKYDKTNGWEKLLSEEQYISVTRKTNNKNIYVGSSKGIYFFHDKHNIRHIPFTDKELKGLPGTEIRDIFIQNDSILWIATNDGLVSLADNRIKIFEHNEDNPNSLIDNNVFTIAQGPHNNLWVATHQGLCLLDSKNESFKDMSQPDNDCLSSRLTSCITEDSKGDIWIGTTEKGLNVLSLKTDTISHYYNQPWNDCSLPDNCVECIFCSSNGIIWVGTHKGMARFDERYKYFKRIIQIGDIQVKGITEDCDNSLWITTNEGLIVTDSIGNILRRFYDYHGLINNNLSRAVCRLRNGNICIGSDYGFNIFSPKQLKEIKPSKNIVITDISVNNLPFATDLNKERKIELGSQQNSFTIGFASTDYEYARHLKYRYKLVPFDKEWSYTVAPILTAKYTSLDFGKYSLIIEASNAFGEWNGTPFTISINIATPWYYSWWFITLFAGSCIFMIWGFIKIREKQLLKDKEQLEALVIERTEKLYQIMENKNKFFNIVSHDLKGPLNNLNLLSESLIEEYKHLDDAEIIHKIEMINKASQNGKTLIDNLQLWVLSQKEIITPAFKQTSLNDEITNVLQLLILDIKKKELSIKIPNVPIMVYTDKNMLSTILRNLISNAIKYSYRKGEIHITAKETKECWIIGIEDFGTGMSPERLKKLFQIGTKVSSLGTEKEKGTGLGLLIVKEFINRLNETINVQSTEGKGSKFIFTLHKTYRNDKNTHC